MNLRPGLRLESATCETQVVVVRAPADLVDVDVRCGGVPLRELDSGEARVPLAAADPSGGTLIGKRYVHEDIGLELLCTRGGAGTLAVGSEPLTVKGAKPLPSSD